VRVAVAARVVAVARIAAAGRVVKFGGRNSQSTTAERGCDSECVESGSRKLGEQLSAVVMASVVNSE